MKTTQAVARSLYVSTGSLFVALLCCLRPIPAEAAPIQFAGRTAELVISTVSERTIRIQLSRCSCGNSDVPAA